MTGEIEPIPPEQARAILDAAILERLGADWDDEETGWVRVSGHDYWTRLARGRTVVDFYVDLVGVVTVQKTTQNTPGDNARLVMLILIALSLVIAFLIVRIATGG
ncbi:MAG TPA: hypothetical protein VHO69_00685 [Phototrophicaceae bacterium]|nr:hypothetical protein [Phototrophicaceae bacterium]